MHTRCPDCRTIFSVTPAQLEARSGLVRCGRCGTLFYADSHLLDPPDAPAAQLKDEDVFNVELGDTDTPLAPPPKLATAPPAMIRLLRNPAVTLIITPLAALLLAGQFLYFYRDELGRRAEFRPLAIRACQLLGCQVAPIPIVPPEIATSTVAPHPTYLNALRVHASMVNRATTAQPYPLLELSLTDSNGALLARRVYLPAQYLPEPDVPATMPPNVALDALLDVTLPDQRATGYEILLLPNPLIPKM